MSDIKFGSEVYTWFMDGYGEGNKNQLGHMIKTVSKAGFKGIEPMVLEPYDTYWMGDWKDPAKLKADLDEAGIELPRGSSRHRATSGRPPQSPATPTQPRQQCEPRFTSCSRGWPHLLFPPELASGLTGSNSRRLQCGSQLTRPISDGLDS